jgi:branched-chain amino acid transport system substrate-binding protein
MTPMLFATKDTSDPKMFVSQYEKPYGRPPNFAAQIGYTGAQLVVQALRNGGRNLTEDSFVSGTESIKDFHDIFGSPTISFSPTKHQGSNESFLCIVDNGKWKPVLPKALGY